MTKEVEIVEKIKEEKKTNNNYIHKMHYNGTYFHLLKIGEHFQNNSSSEICMLYIYLSVVDMNNTLCGPPNGHIKVDIAFIKCWFGSKV